MSVNQLLTLSAQLFFILLGLITFIDFLRHQDKTRRDIALVFGSLGFNFAVLVLIQLAQVPIPWLSRIGTMALVAQPYFLLRVVRHFRSVSPLIHRLGLLGLGGSWIIFSLFNSPPPLITLIMVVYFVGLNGYAAGAFIQGALSTAGVVRQRLRLAAIGSGLLALLLILLAIATVDTLRVWLTTPALLVGMGSALTFYLGFAPPRWLRRAWQLNELQRFLPELQARTTTTRLSQSEILHRLSSVANQTVGGITTVIIQRKILNDPWILHNPLNELNFSDVPWQKVEVLERVWQERQPVALQSMMNLTATEQRLLTHTGAGTVLLVPLTTNDRTWGILLTFLRYSSLFLEDDLSVLTLLAQQSALVLENEALFEHLSRYNQELEQKSTQLINANQELEAFSYSVSHDLRSPLRAIHGFGRILQEDYADQFPEGAQRYLNLIRDNARQMGQLIDDLLTFSRLSRQPLKHESVAIGALVQQLWEKLCSAEENRLIEFTLADLPTCQVDPALMTQVWVNLLANALKYTGKCEVARIEVGYQVQQNCPTFFVKDNGAGFDMRYADKLFGVFQRLHRVDEYEGTGVGLAIVQRIIQRHGGTIWAEAAVNQGATFYFALEPGAMQHEYAS